VNQGKTNRKEENQDSPEKGGSRRVLEERKITTRRARSSSAACVTEEETMACKNGKQLLGLYARMEGGFLWPDVGERSGKKAGTRRKNPACSAQSLANEGGCGSSGFDNMVG